MYYSSAIKDHWVLASAASRAEATKNGYTKVGTLGYAMPIPADADAGADGGAANDAAIYE